MTVGDLILKLQQCPQDAVVLTDDVTIACDAGLGEAVIVAAGTGYKVLHENHGTDFWVGQMPWRYSTVELEAGVVYIGSGHSIVGNMWERKG